MNCGSWSHVLVERRAAETVTKGGIMLPEKPQGKVLQAMVVAVGFGSKGNGGQIQPFSTKVGDKSSPTGEGNGNLLQYSCLEMYMDRGAWRAAVHWGYMTVK